MAIIRPENRSLHTSVGQKRDWGAPGRSEASRSALFPTLPPACRQCDGRTPPLAQQALDRMQRTASTRHHFPAPLNTMHRRPSAAARSETFTTPSLLLYSSLDSPCSRTRSPGRAITIFLALPESSSREQGPVQKPQAHRESVSGLGGFRLGFVHHSPRPGGAGLYQYA